ncbi:MAG: short-chain dehydrogenase/reductase [Henriciella sp.]|uniref:SDR family NAD(P)-dependent oxidoreductase n=1 Tax=Henriciella sp. TaxID=1968823 RepID=UPI000C0F6575|nr:SDR family NAD(P)-dependent oxidoreductase [Henriciella sp.]MAN72732.1 short-chain dehydrogenase/reductase [Henriciella sp.]PHR78566.1 MAG: short-chain dehydrogenase/reductase [Henriciella sp.]|tara:strand:+ start:5403 stop:6419 length:1017 start_codon:yes stop_codon:yes gene_type:complete
MSSPVSPSRRQLLMGAGAAALAMSSASAAAQSAGSGRSAGAGLTGKSVLITGTSSGFGRLGAEHYARLGAKVFATMRNLPRPEADELRALAEDEGLDITVIEIDVTSDEQVEAGVAEAEAAAGGTLDVLINNAGIAMSGPIEVQDLEATKLMFDTNVFGAQRMIRAALPAMREAGRGQIFNVTSQLGRLIIPGLGQYSPTKFALEALSEQLAYETVEKGIDVTIIQPGGYPTEIWQNAADRSAALKTRSRDSLIEAYPQLTAGMGEASNGGGNTDPMDVPRAIAEIIAMPAGQRPLRKPVHPAAKPQIPINKVSAEQQLAMLGGSGYGPWLRAVLKNG